jgi:hypothetical protein
MDMDGRLEIYVYRGQKDGEKEMSPLDWRQLDLF